MDSFRKSKYLRALLTHHKNIAKRHFRMPLISIDALIFSLLHPVSLWSLLLTLLYVLPTSWAKALIVAFVLIGAIRHGNTRYKRRGEWRTIGARDTAIVTGGSNGLGLEISKRLIEKRVKVIIIDRVVPTDAEVKHQAEFLSCDLNDIECFNYCIYELKRRKVQPTILINNAAIRQDETLKDISYSKISEMIQINLMSPIRLMKEFCNTKGQLYVVNISSVLGLASPSHLSIYSATKAALMSLHDTISHEIINERIRFLLVAPGQLNTSMFKDVKPPKQFLAPLVDTKSLSHDIMRKIELGERGVLHGPLYTYFIPLMRMLPYSLAEFARWFSEMDTSVSSTKQDTQKK